MVSTSQEHQLASRINDHSQARDLHCLSRTMGRLGGAEGEGLKEDHKEGFRGTDVKLPERQLCGGVMEDIKGLIRDWG